MGAVVISAFPGTGKSDFFKKMTSMYKIADSDSSEFSWIIVDGQRVRNPHFVQDYFIHLEKVIAENHLVFVSTHSAVREELRKREIPHFVVYPHKNCKKEYLERYRARGSNEEFVSFMDKNWETFIGELDQESAQHYGEGNFYSIRIAGKGWYLGDIVSAANLIHARNAD